MPTVPTPMGTAEGGIIVAMSFLWRRIRPEVDYSSLYDGSPDDDRPLPAPGRARRVLACVGVIVFGAILVTAAVVVGIRVDWVLTDMIPLRRSEIWAWVPMVFFGLGGLAIAAGGVFLLTRTLASGRGNA